MLNLRSNEARLDDLLNRIAEGLQLDETRFKKMETAYKAVSEWIENDWGFFRNVQFEIYPHGSVLAGTTVKPTEEEEFDLDFVIHIRMDWSKYDPEEVYKELKRRLLEHETYRKMLQLKNRVLRLNYSGDFHIDIMPGCQKFTDNPDLILIRDRKLEGNVSSNPRGYGNWFNDKADIEEEFLLEKVYAMEDLPEQEAYHLKKPLKRAVQLIKRYRNVYFAGDAENATSSIILTTLAGQFYGGEKTIYETVNTIVSEMHRATQAGLYDFKVLNPVNPDEEFTDKWRNEPQLFHRFIDFVKDFKQMWEKIKRESHIIQNKNELNNMFGDHIISKAINEQRQYFTKAFGTELSINGENPDEYDGLHNLAIKSKPYSKL